MALKILSILSVIIYLHIIAGKPQQDARSPTSTSMYYYDNADQPILCYFVGGQPLCGEEGEKARQADRERVRRLRDEQRNTNPSSDGFQEIRGDPGTLPQGDAPFQDDAPVSHPRNRNADNYKGHVPPGNNKGGVVPPTPPPTTPKPPCPPPPTDPPPCPPKTTTTASPCQPITTTLSPCQQQVTDHPDIAEWKRTRNQPRTPGFQVLQSFQSDAEQQARSDFDRNRQAWISAATLQENNIQSDQPIEGDEGGWWRRSDHKNAQGRQSTTKKVNELGGVHNNDITAIQNDQAIEGNSTGWWFKPSEMHDNDNAGVQKIPEIDVGRRGVILTVKSEESETSRPRSVPKSTPKANNIQYGIASGLGVGLGRPRGRLSLYTRFQKKADDRQAPDRGRRF